MLANLRVLIVDDDRDTCELLQWLFELQGAVVKTARSVEAAISVYTQFLPDVLVSDLLLPYADGFALLQRIQALRLESKPAVAITAMATAEYRKRALAAGYLCCLFKPLEVEELVQQVAQAVGRASATHPPCQDVPEATGSQPSSTGGAGRSHNCYERALF